MAQKNIKVGEAAFKEAYAALNAAQKQAVDTIDGPVMVIAGPGTGKTQILTLRIANILLRTDSKPENILALTFTESGARAMRERLMSLIGELAYDVSIFTFHGFADTLIQKYPDAYPTIIGGRAASDIERIQIIEAILTDTSFTSLRPSGDPAYYVKPIRDAIATLKQEYISPDSFATSVAIQAAALDSIERYHTKGAHAGKERGEYKEAAKQLTRNQELLMAYRLYESALRSQGLYDFGDMITRTVEALSKDEDMLRDLQERYHYVLADEHQDVNGSQNKILELLVNFHDQPNLFVVGDEKQAIYRFQGASLDNFLYFDSTFGKTTTISLTENYRSGQPILNVAQDLIKTDDPVLAPLRTPLTAALVEEAEVEQYEFSHQVVEDSFVVAEIQRDIKNGVSPDQIAVIVRTNREVEHYAVALRKQGVAVTPSADSDILEHPVTHAVYTLVKAIAKPTDETTLITLLHEPYVALPIKDLAVILRSHNRNLPLATLLRDKVRLTELGVESISTVLNLTMLIDSVREESLTKSPHRLLEQILEQSGFIAHVLKNDPFEGVRIIRRLYDEVEGMVGRDEARSLYDVLKRLDLHREYGIALEAPYIPTGQKAVTIMTAHKSKGLEFEVVYIPHMSDRVWGSKRSRDIFKLPIVKHEVGEFDASEDDECRLLYVAMTRAKQRLVLSCAGLNPDGKEQTTSRFLTGLTETEITYPNTDTYETVFSPVQDIKTLKPLPITTEILLSTLDQRGFSPTSLNNYLKSPWEYFYRNVLQVPQIKTTELQYGSAVHAVLDCLVKHKITKGVEVTINDIKELLTISLNKEAISDEEFTRLHKRGMEALVVYLEHLIVSVRATSRTEVKLEAELPTGLSEYPFLKLNGALDRVDYDGERIMRVVDYKTGKPKTKGQIEGTTADSNGDYKRQLTFYALLLSLQDDTSKHCRTGVLSFVEPDAHGKIKEESFTITDEEIKSLKTELIAVTKEIVSGQALTVSCDETVCHYCDLVSVWQTK